VQEADVAKKYIVTLTDEERESLLTMTKKGKIAARKLNRVHILLQADAGATDDAIAEALHVGTATVERVRKRFVEEGVTAAISERPRPGARRKLDGKTEAFLVALACSTPPDDRVCWTMQLLADRLVACTELDGVSADTVRRALKKTNSSPG
jgi:transposase